MNLLELAGYGTDAIGLAVGGWYTSTKIVERARKRDTRLAVSLLAEPPSPAARPSGPKPVPGPLSADPGGEADTTQNAGGLLGFMLGQTGQPYPTAGLPVPGPVPGLLSIGPADDEETEPEAEKLLVAKLTRFSDPLFGLATGSLEWLWRRLALLGWLRLAVAVPLALVLFGVGSVLYCVMLPFAIVGFLFDSGKDFRLRIIVLAFAAGICLQLLGALPG